MPLPPADLPSDSRSAHASPERRRALERIVFSNGDPAAIDRATRELRKLDVARSAPEAQPIDRPAAPTEASVDAFAEATEAAADAEAIDSPSPRRPYAKMALAAVGILLGGIAIGSLASTSGVNSATPLVEQPALALGEPLPSPSPGQGTAFINIDTGQVVGYGGIEPAEALEIFDREQTDADLPLFPLAADLQPSTTRLLERVEKASIYAAMDTLARPCVVVVGPNHYSATCQTEFQFPKAGIRLSWALPVEKSGVPTGWDRSSPVVYTVVWMPDGMVDVGALVQGG